MDEREATVLAQVKRLFERVLGDELTGIYVHGSTALGSFQWERSDIDFLAVVERAPTLAQKAELMRGLVDLHEHANPRGLEMSVVLAEVCRQPTFPTPFELHFSEGTLGWYRSEPERYVREMNGDDPDIGSYMAVIKQSGVVLAGKPIAEVFGDLPEDVYLRSVMNDLNDAREDFAGNFAYHTLNLCRTLAYKSDGVIRSKQAGGEWGLAHLPPAFAGLISRALAVYVDGADERCEPAEGEAFLQYILPRLDGSADGSVNA